MAGHHTEHVFVPRGGYVAVRAAGLCGLLVAAAQAILLAKQAPALRSCHAAPDAKELALRQRGVPAHLQNGAVSADAQRGLHVLALLGVEQLDVLAAAGRLAKPVAQHAPPCSPGPNVSAAPQVPA